MVAPALPDATAPLPSRWRADVLGRLTADHFCLGVLTAVLAVSCWRILAGGVTAGQDAMTQFYPWYSYLGERLREFGIPSWNPSQFSGAPFASDPQSGWSYLPAMAFFTAFPLAIAVPIFIVFHLALAGYSVYVLARILRIPPLGALAAGSAYMLSGPIFSRSVCCPAQLQVGAWVPLLLVGAELALQQPILRRRVPWIVVSALAMSQILASWLGQGSYYALMLVGAYLGWRALIQPVRPGVPWRERFYDFFSTSIVFGALAAGFNAMGLLPRLEYNRLSNVAGGSYDGLGDSAAITGGWQAGQTVFEHVTRNSYYPGGIAVGLAVVAVILTRGRNLTVFFSLIVVGGFVLSSSRQTPLHDVLFTILPMFEGLHSHWPQRIALVVFPAVALLAGAAIGALPSWAGRQQGVWSIALLPIGIAVVFAVGLRRAGDALPWVVWLSVAAVALALLLLGAKRCEAIWRYLPGVVTGLLILDLLAANREMLAHGDYGGFHKFDIAAYYEITPGLQFIQGRTGDEAGRYFGFDPMLRHSETERPALYRFQFPSDQVRQLGVNNLATVHRMYDVQGYNPVQLQAYVDFMHDINGEAQEYHDANIYPGGLDSNLLDLLNARYIIVPVEIPEGRADLQAAVDLFPTVYQDDDIRVLERSSAAPKGWIVHEARSAQASVARLLVENSEIDPYQVALIDRDSDLVGDVPVDGNDTVTVLESEPEIMRYETVTAAPGMLVTSEIAYPAWNAYIDGEPVEIATAFGLLRAVEIPAGTHIVEFRFESPNEVWGMALTILAILTAGALLAWCRLEGKPQ
ncbi:MAG: YfhO family protein [Thermomicrobiales bacterium]|nr:YfhO family protein [Thermomicrobiales bacterium]MCO5220020.1 hypothetical protein [Thermomicrobiales bacterium]